MKITTPSPVRTAHRVRQLASTYPLECARALAQQPEAIPQVGRALAPLADAAPAAEILVGTLKRHPGFIRSARSFYDRRRALEPVPLPPPDLRPEITTARERP